MKILTIDSSKKQAIISLSLDNKKIVHKTEENKSHSEFLLAEIENLLIKHEQKIQDIDVFGVNVGPGSFTGIRIGLAFVKAFLMANNSKAVSVNNFEIMSYNIVSKPDKYMLVLNSNNEEIYYAKVENDNYYYGFDTIENLNKQIKTENLKVYCEKSELSCFSNLLNLEGVEISDDTLLNLTIEKANNNDFIQINNLAPKYIKKSQAEQELYKKIQQNLIISETVKLEDFIILENKCFEDAYSQKLLEQDLKNQNRKLYFAYFNEELVGYINFEVIIDEISLIKICVLPEFREYNIASKLMQKMFEFYKENNIKQIFLEVSAKNNPAQKLYQKFNFKLISTRKNYYKNGADALIYVYDN